MAKQNDWKERLGMVYSTNSDFEYSYEENEPVETLAPQQQKLYVQLDRKQRKGKSVTLITGFVGSADDLKELAKILKTKWIRRNPALNETHSQSWAGNYAGNSPRHARSMRW